MPSKVERAIRGKLNIPKEYGTPLVKRDFIDKPVVGYDIEADALTAKPFLVGVSTPNKEHSYIVHSWNDCLKFLYCKKSQNSYNFFYNLQYDIEGMFKFLPEETLLHIYHKGEVVIDEHGYLSDDGFTAKYIPGKLFLLKRGKKVAKFYDMAQYYKSSLDNAAKKYLDVNKDDFEARFTSSKLYFNTATLEEENKRFDTFYFSKFTSPKSYAITLEKYCIKDAVLCRKLSERLLEGLKKFVGATSFISSASIAESYFRSNGLELPKLSTSSFKMFMLSYYGGRFEMMKRGVIENQSLYDINSAYPAAMAQMPILTNNVKYRYTEEPDFDSCYGSYKVQVQVPEDLYLSPFPKRGDTLFFPNGNFETWTDKLTLEMYDNLGYDYKISEGYELVDNQATNTLEPLINTLYAVKSDKSIDSSIRDTSKIIMNGQYGKFIQLLDDTDFTILNDIEELEALNQNDVFLINDEIWKREHTDNFETGKYFAPYYASHITASCRKQIYEKTIQVKQNNCTSIQTDSLTTNIEIETDKLLGGWSIENYESGDEIKNSTLEITKPGFYKLKKEDDFKVRSRGVGRVNSIYEKSYEVKRRNGLGMTARNNFDNLNLIINKELQQNYGNDKKRVWEKEFDFKLFDERTYQDSKPNLLV